MQLSQSWNRMFDHKSGWNKKAIYVESSLQPNQVQECKNNLNASNVPYSGDKIDLEEQSVKKMLRHTVLVEYVWMRFFHIAAYDST